MNDNKYTGEENLETEDGDFAKLLEESSVLTDNFAVGESVHGKVVFISDDSVFMDINGKSEAVIEISEFVEKNKPADVKVGDTFDAFIVSIGGGEIRLTRTIGKSAASAQLLETAYHSSIPVEGTIIGTSKGGYRVSISDIHCFCPFSQVDIKPHSDPETLIGKRFTYRIIQYEERGKNIVLSRKALLDEKRMEREEELRKSLNVGDTVSGEIISILEFGLFVDIGGFEALVPRSEASWSRKSNLDSFPIGEKIETKVISIDWDKKRIALSIKQLLDEPWTRIGNFQIGEQYNGRVSNFIRSGAFVELEPGLEGFIPLSRMSLIKRVNKPEEVISLNSDITVKVLDINNEDKRIALELITDEPDPWQLPAGEITDTTHTAVVESVHPAGLSVRLSNGMAGFIPLGELTANKGNDVQREYPAGKEFEVAVKDFNPTGKKLILSERRVKNMKEKEEFSQYMNQSQTGSSGSTFGSLFKEKFEEMKTKTDNGEDKK